MGKKEDKVVACAGDQHDRVREGSTEGRDDLLTLRITNEKLLIFKVKLWAVLSVAAAVSALAGRPDIAVPAAGFSVLLGGPDVVVLARKVAAANG